MKYNLRYKVANLLRRKGYKFNEAERPEVISMQREIASLGSGVTFEIKTFPDGSWIANSTNVEGILTGSRNQSEVHDLIKDAIFTYYGVPPQYANDKLLRNTGEPVTTEQQVHVTA